METKFFEVRDAATLIPVMAQKFWPSDATTPEGELAAQWLLARAGFRNAFVLVTRLDPVASSVDPWGGEWGSARTMQMAHQYIDHCWDELKSGQVIDVEFIMGETSQPKTPERDQTIDLVRNGPVPKWR